MESDGNYVYLNMPPETTESIVRKTLYYRTVNSVTPKIENVSMTEVD